ncbi:MAG: acetyl-CoA carboxylase biotin carboxylase subunit [Clostridiales bacterium]|nr:acetyl-CoA carboxylase biotin carboxylase subunit [Clostridiales bacterium]
MFSKILIANRGEIAVRIIRACREMGISTVAICSEADKDAMHVQLADESYCVGGSRVADSYLNVPAILTVAVESGAQAIHPGYGLLSENAKFVSLCEQCNINFIGPSSDMIKLLGDKDNARKTMRAAGVPVTPGCDIVEDVEQAKQEAEKIGFPLLIKARSGGGGKGIRKVESMESFEESFLAASSEAQSAFGDGACYLERFIHPVKHIEMQLLCDKYGNVICLGERECSVQRKNQKMIEESPSPALDEKTRKLMMAAAVKAAKAVDYVNAGTGEFLLDRDNNFYFMEMNTRLQVEHGVTEMVTGLDIVQWQIRIAAGAKLLRTQDSIFTHGNVIECRINAENPEKGFRPSCGRITRLHTPGGSFVRFDTAIYQDYFVPPYYDSMIGKLIVQGRNRAEAIRKMKMALSELTIDGIDINCDLLAEILSDEQFVSGEYTTDFMAEFEEKHKNGGE